MPQIFELPTLAISAHGFLFQGGEAAICISGRKATMTHGGIVFCCLAYHGNQFIRQLGRERTPRHDVFAANQFPRLFKDSGGMLGSELVKGQANGRVCGDATGSVRTSTDGTDNELTDTHRSRDI